MRPPFWHFGSIRIDLDDSNASVRIVYGKTVVRVLVEFYLSEAARDPAADDQRRRAEDTARERVLDMVSFLGRPQTGRSTLRDLITIKNRNTLLS